MHLSKLLGHSLRLVRHVEDLVGPNSTFAARRRVVVRRAAAGANVARCDHEKSPFTVHQL